jgi:hypothetical protein
MRNWVWNRYFRRFRVWVWVWNRYFRRFQVWVWVWNRYFRRFQVWVWVWNRYFRRFQVWVWVWNRYFRRFQVWVWVWNRYFRSFQVWVWVWYTKLTLKLEIQFFLSTSDCLEIELYTMFYDVHCHGVSSNHGGMHRFGFTIKSTLSVFHVGVYIIRTEEDMSICGRVL